MERQVIDDVSSDDKAAAFHLRFGGKSRPSSVRWASSRVRFNAGFCFTVPTKQREEEEEEKQKEKEKREREREREIRERMVKHNKNKQSKTKLKPKKEYPIQSNMISFKINTETIMEMSHIRPLLLFSLP